MQKNYESEIAKVAETISQEELDRVKALLVGFLTKENVPINKDTVDGFSVGLAVAITFFDTFADPAIRAGIFQCLFVASESLKRE